MKSQLQAHLKDEKITWAVIDENELAGQDRQHLFECRLCRRKVEQFKKELQGFGVNAMSTVPPLTKRITLPGEELNPVNNKSSWFQSFGTVAMAGLVLFIYFLVMESPTPRYTPLQSPGISMEDELLMDEIFEMVENPLSDELYEITGDNGGFDEEFLEFVVPDIQEDFQSKYIIQGGMKKC